MQVSAQQTDDAIAREVERVLASEVDDQHLKALLDAPGSFDQKLWALAGEQGWCGIALPENIGGLGLDWKAMADVAQVLGHATVSLPLLHNTLTAQALLNSDHASQCSELLTALAAGEQCATWALSSAEDAGLPVEPSVVFDQGQLHGETGFCAFAAVADVALIYASQNNQPVIALATLDESVGRTVVDMVDNARAMAALTFKATPAVIVQDSMAPLHDLLATAAVLTAFEQIGGAAASMDLARQYAMEHRAFGQPIGAFQAIKHKIADIYTAIEIARGCALEALDELSSDSLSLRAAAAARISASRAYDLASQEAIQVHGGMGITWEAFLHHHYRRARTLALELGSNAYWRNVLLDELVADHRRGEAQ